MFGKKSYFTLAAIWSLFAYVLGAGTIDTKKFDLDAVPRDLVWCGTSRETVLLLTENNSLYKSEDKGFNWRLLNGILTSTGKDQLDENENEIGRVSKILQSPVDPSLLIFLGTHGINWIGEDCGRKIKALNHGRKIKEFQFHPTERNWGLATAFTLCDDFVNEPCKIYKELYLTKDLGENWDLLGSYIVQFAWGVADEAHIKAGIPKERILLSYEPRGKGNQKHSGWNYKIDFVYSDDFFKTKKISVQKGNKFMITKNYLYVAQVVDQENQEVALLVTNSTHNLYDFQPIETNTKTFREHSYTFLDASEGSVFLHINHFGENSRYGHIYISDAKGVKFSQSVKYNVRSNENQCDFEKVNNLEGIFLTNIISRSYMKNAEQEMEEEQINIKQSMGSESNKLQRSQKSHLETGYRDYLKTLLTFNKGGDWRRIPAPERDVNGKRYDCGEYCFLNLFGTSSEYPPYYSVDSAVGIILANGNVGRYLSHDNESVATFLSRDGGLNWFEIRKGSHIYEIGDHGALIVIADDQNPGKEIFYSWDEGMTFEPLKISDEKFLIKNIIIEPSSTSQHFVIYGESHKKGDSKGIVIGVDFTGLHEPQCRNPDRPGASDSDYETWSPNDGRAGHDCLMGHKTIYLRRKRESQCYNGLLFERKTIIEHCECTEDDYECDFGFTRAGRGEPCVSITNRKPAPNLSPFEVYSPPENCNEFYTISRGYRKVPGNTCVNGVKFDPFVFPCPYNGVFARLGGVFFIIVFALLVVVAFFLFNKGLGGVLSGFLFSASTQQQDSYRDTVVTNKRAYVNIDHIEGDDNNMLFEDGVEESINIKSSINKEKKKDEE